MTGLETRILSEVIQDARSGFACGEDSPSGVFQFRMNNITTDGQLDFARKRRVPSATKNIKSFLVDPGDVLFNATNSPELVGKSAYFQGHEEPAVFSNHFIRLRPRAHELDGAYLGHWLVLQFERGVFRGMCRQWVNQAAIARDSLLALRIPLPPLAEQRRIAEALDRAEALRAKRRVALAQLDSLTQSLFLDLFGDPVTNAKGWPTMLLGDAADIASGITKGRKLNGEKTREVPYLAVVNVQDRALNLSVVKTIEATDAEIARYQLKFDDLVLTEGGDPDKLGRGTLWNGALSECIHQNHIFRVRIAHVGLAPIFVNWLIGGARGKRYFLKSAKQTTGIASINMTQLRGFPLLLPPVNLQHEFARRVAAVERLKSAHRTALAELDALFASLQHRGFRGEL